MNCPVCNAPGFYDVFAPDCANPNCVNFRGTYTYAAEVAAAPQPRKASITYRRMTPPDPNSGEDDVSEEDGYQWEGTIEPDEDETWPERLARFIKDELGHVESSGRWWTQSDWHTIDYGTGEEEQLSAHYDPDEWTDEEINEVDRLLKKWKLMS